MRFFLILVFILHLSPGNLVAEEKEKAAAIIPDFMEHFLQSIVKDDFSYEDFLPPDDVKMEHISARISLDQEKLVEAHNKAAVDLMRTIKKISKYSPLDNYDVIDLQFKISNLNDRTKGKHRAFSIRSSIHYKYHTFRINIHHVAAVDGKYYFLMGGSFSCTSRNDVTVPEQQKKDTERYLMYTQVANVLFHIHTHLWSQSRKYDKPDTVKLVKFENRTIFMEGPDGEVIEKNIGMKGHNFIYEEAPASKINGVPEEFKDSAVLIKASPPSGGGYQFLINKGQNKPESGFPVFIKKTDSSEWTLKLPNQQYD